MKNSYKKKSICPKQVKRKIQRMCVYALYYSILLGVTVSVMMGMIWMMSHVKIGLLVISAFCLMAAGLLFFRMGQEGEERGQKMTSYAS